MKNDMRNGSGCKDLTAGRAIANTSAEQIRVGETIELMKKMARLAGYKVDSRIILRDEETGQVWK